MSQRSAFAPRRSQFCWSQTFSLFFFAKHHRKTFEIDSRKTQLNALTFQTTYVFVSCFFLASIPSLKILLNNELFLSIPRLSLTPAVAEGWYRALAVVMLQVTGLLLHTPNLILTAPRMQWLANFQYRRRSAILSVHSAALYCRLLKLLFSRMIFAHNF